MPLEAHSPQPWGKRVGGVSGRPMRATGRSNPSAYPGRNGGRHPGSRDAGNLRGLTEKRGSWPVRLVCAGLVPMQAVAPATAGVLWKNEEGNVVSVRQAHALFKETPNKRLRERGHVLRSVQRPVHVNRHCNSLGESRARWRGGSDIAVGQTHESGRNRHRGLGRRTNARLAAPHRSSSEEVVREASEKEGGHGHRPCEENESPVLSVRTSWFSCRSRQAASWSRISSNAAPQKGWRFE
jgi:hypothetical protein